MSTELAVQNAQLGQLNAEQVDLLKDSIARGASDIELALFLEVCRSKSLDPFSKEIYLVKRWDQGLGREIATAQVGIDGYRSLAERTGLYAGQDGPYWCGEDGNWQDVWVSSQPPSAAKVGVYRHGFLKPIWGVALYSEYVQTGRDQKPNMMWRKMPANQLSKCAESLALRKAFPKQLGGVYTNEEMAQAEQGEQQPQYNHDERKQLIESKLSEATSAGVDVQQYEPTEEKQAEAKRGGVKPRRGEGKTGIQTLLDAFKELKPQFSALGFPEMYYTILGSYGKKHSNEFIGDMDAGRDCYKDMRRFIKLKEYEAIQAEEQKKHGVNDSDAAFFGENGPYNPYETDEMQLAVGGYADDGDLT